MSTIDYGEVTDSTKMYQLIKDLLDAYKRNIEQADAVAHGDLRAAATYENDSFTLRWKGETLALVLRLPEHWRWIEQGRPPTVNSEGGVLYDAILEWINVKHIVPRPDRYGKVPSVSSLAYLITRKIHRRGYFDPNHQGKHLLQGAIDRVDLINRFKSVLTDQFNRAIQVELADNLTKILNK